MKATQQGSAGTSSRPLQIIRPGDGDPRHGTVSAYNNHQCRCPECRAGWAAYQRELRQRKRAAIGSV